MTYRLNENAGHVSGADDEVSKTWIYRAHNVENNL